MSRTSSPADIRYGLLVSLDLSLHSALDRLRLDAPEEPPNDLLERLTEAGYVRHFEDDDTYSVTKRGIAQAALLLVELGQNR